MRLDMGGDGAFNRDPDHEVGDSDVLAPTGRFQPMELARMAIRIKTRGNESAEQMMRRFKKLCEKEGLTKDIKKREYYEKPSERKRRAARRSAPRV